MLQAVQLNNNMWIAFLGLISGLLELLNKVWPSAIDSKLNEAKKEEVDNENKINNWFDTPPKP